MPRRRGEVNGTSALAETAPLLEVADLEKRFRTHGQVVHAVNGVSFSVYQGETVALVGESGCGKSTTARCIVRLTDPTAGRILFRGRDVSAISRRAFRALRPEIQMVFQDPGASLNPSMTIRQTLREPFRLHNGARRNDLEARVQESMRLVQLEPSLLGRRPDQLSGGQKQRVGIARAIATNPALVVLDEPTSSLDMSLRLALLELLEDLQRRLGMTYLFITHDFSAVRHIADRVVVMYLGKVMESGLVDEVLDDPKHPYTQALIAAIPVPEPRTRPRAKLKGETPSALRPIVGCPFQDRCPHVMEECRQGEIPLVELGHRKVACLLYGESASPSRTEPAAASESR
jgi:oligopeptide/dipeptide ABC transporter ATP-binding protein